MDANDELVRPTDYRSWVYVGTPLTPNELNNGKAAFPEFHNVYIDPMSYDHYKKTGEWKGYDETTGQLIYEGSFVAGEKSGLWKVYDKNGKLTTEKTFN